MKTESSLHIINQRKEEGGHVMDDRISALPDDVLVGIVQLLDLRAAVRAGALARRWRRLPRLLPNLAIDVADLLIPHPEDFSPHTVDHIMATYTDAARWLLAPTRHRRIRNLRLTFYLIDPYLRSIGHAVAEGGISTAEHVDFTIRTEVDDDAISCEQAVLFAQRFMSFVGACPVAFRQLTSLTLQNLRFGGSDVHDLLNTCNRLELLSLRRCDSAAGVFPVLVIDSPSSSLLALELHSCYYRRVELIRVPKLEHVLCDVDRMGGSFTVRFGDVPRLRNINLSTVHLRYYYEDPSELSPVFRNLRDIYLCDLNTHKMVWTLFVLEAAPFLEKLSIKLYQPWTDAGPYHLVMVGNEKGGTTPKFEHHNLVLLQIEGYGLEEDKEVARYIRLITERAVCLKRILLLQQSPYTRCTGVRGARYACQVNEAQNNQLRKVFPYVFSSSVEITLDHAMA